MFFFFSKVLSAFTTPMLIICGCLITAAIFKPGRWKKNLFVAGLAMLLFFSNGFIINAVMLGWEVPATPFNEIKKQYAWGILLTGVTRPEAEPHDRVYFQRGADRLTHTLQLYHTGIIKNIFISGGTGKLMDTYTREADEMKSVLMMMGVPESNIRTENASRNTRENAVFSVAQLKAVTTPDECILITSAYHMRRARACFTKENWKMDVFSTDFLTYDGKIYLDQLLIPRAEAMVNWNILIKELVGCSAYWLAGYI